MKTTILLLQKLTLACGLIILGFTSCKKEAVKSETSTLDFSHVAPDLASVNVFLDGKQVNTSPLVYNSQINPMEIAAGMHTVRILNPTNGVQLLTSTFSLSKDRSYTFYLANRSANLQGVLLDNPEAEVIKDKAQVRILNLSHDSPAYNLGRVGTSANLFTNVGYRLTTAYTAIDAPVNGTALNLQVKHPTTNATVSNINTTIFSGKTYTIVLRGFATPPTGNTNSLAFTTRATKR